MNTEYKLSGKSGNVFIVGLILGPIFLTVIGVIYSYVTMYSPSIYLNILVFCGLLYGIYMTQKMVVKWSKCRSILSARIYGFIVGVFSVYVCWVSFLFVFWQYYDIWGSLSIGLFDLFLNPSLVFDTIYNLSKTGFYSLFGIPIKGFVLWLIWGIESTGIIAAGIMGGMGVLHEEIFCENCNRWAEKINLNLNLSIQDRSSAKAAIERNVMELINYPAFNYDRSENICVNLHQCSKCKNTSTIDVDLITYSMNDKGEIERSAKDFSAVYVLDNKQYQQFFIKHRDIAEIESSTQG